MTDPLTPEKLTLRWLFDHVPVGWWISFFVLLGSAATIGFSFGAKEPAMAWLAELSLGTLSAENVKLKKENAEFNASKAQVEQNIKTLRSEIDRLQQQLSSASTASKEVETLRKEIEVANGRIRELESRNNSLLKDMDVRNSSQKQVEELESKLTKLRLELSRISEANASLVTDKQQLEKEVKQLSSKLRAAATDRKAQSSETASSRATPSPSSKYNTSELISALPHMNSGDIPGFLIATIPSIRGGISCTELSQMVKYGYSSEVDTVIKKVAPYVRRPFGEKCIARLNAQMYATESASAIRALLSSSPNY